MSDQKETNSETKSGLLKFTMEQKQDLLITGIKLTATVAATIAGAAIAKAVTNKMDEKSE